MNDYASDLRRHLTSYKDLRLGVEEQGIFLHKGRQLRYGHILPHGLKWLNILEPFRKEIRAYLSKNSDIKLHKYFHHLNSSQAFALNLFFPFFENDASTALLRALGLEGSISAWYPERISDIKEGTNVDVAWHDADGRWTYCEVKFSEQDFGKAKCDEKHLDKLRRIYGPALGPYCPAELLEPATFFRHYQILRNVYLAACDTAASVVFLLPARNKLLWKPLREVKALLHPSLANRIYLTDVGTVLSRLVSDKTIPDRLSWYAEQLSEKYMFPASST